MSGPIQWMSDQDLLAALRSYPQAQLSAPNPSPYAPTQPVRAPQSASPVAGLSDAQLMAQLRNANPQMSTMEDVGRSVATGLEKAGAGTAGVIGDLRNFAGQAGDYLSNKTLQAMGAEPPDQNTHLVSSSLNGPFTPSPVPGVPLSEMPDSAFFNQQIQKGFGPYHQPQTGAGRFGETLGEMAPMALAPGGPLVRAARTLLPTLGAEGAGELSNQNPWMRVAGGFAGSGVEGLAEAIQNAPKTLLAKGMANVSLQDIAGMQARMERSPVPLTPIEALEQETNGASGTNALQHFIENSPTGKPLMTSFMAARPGQVSQAVNDFADTIAPRTSQPGMIGQRAQTAAQGGLDEIRKTINSIADPNYQALASETLPDDQHAILTADPAYASALNDVRSNPILNAPIEHLPDSNLSVVNEVVKRLNRNAEASALTQMNPNGDNQLSAAYGNAARQADAMASGVSQNWRDAHDIVSGGRSVYLDPLEAGPAGSIAKSKSDQLSSAIESLFPSKPMQGAPNETAQAIRLLTTKDPNVAADLTAQHVRSSFAESAQDLQPGENQWGGSKWVAQTAGNPEQRATLQSGLSAINPDLVGQYDELTDALRATGRRLAPGSGTAFNVQRQGAFASLPTPIKIAGAALDPLELGKHLDNAVGGMLYKRNVSTLADMLIHYTPEQAAQFLTSAQQPNPDALARALFNLNASSSGAQP